MSDIKGLLPCSKCGVFPILFYETPNMARTKVKLSCPNCENTVIERNYEDAVIAWNYYYGKHTSKCMAIVKFKDGHYERVDQVYNNSGTGKFRFIVNGEIYLYNPDYLEDETPSICCGIRKYIRRANHTFLKYDKSIGKFCVTDDMIQLFISKTDEGIDILETMLQTGKEKEKREEKNEMKDILELVGKIEDLLKKSKFEWFMCYDPKEKSWNFQIKEK